jgi:hypothetical protein
MFVISRCARYLPFAAMHLTDLRYFLAQFHDAFFDGILHDDRLAGHLRTGTRRNRIFAAEVDRLALIAM